jgi:hypothetical protein
VARAKFELRDLKPGRYIVTATVPGPQPLRRQLVVVR